MPHIPNECRIGAIEYVSAQMLDTTNISPDEVLLYAKDRVSEKVTRHVFRKLAKTRKCPLTQQCVIEIDCVVLSNDQLKQIILEARQEGAQDALRYPSTYGYKIN